MERKVEITAQSIKTELASYANKAYECLFEYVWNSLDAGATSIDIKYTIPSAGIGRVEDVELIDNGRGWNFESNENTTTFLSSTKAEDNNKQRTLPRGKFGRGRYAFIWIAKNLEIYSNKKKLSLTSDTKVRIVDSGYDQNGTKVCFFGITDDFSSALASEHQLQEAFLIEFGWFIRENPNISISLNGTPVDPNKNVKETIILRRNDFSEEVGKNLDDDFQVEIVLWDKKPAEWSNFYFLDKDRRELFKISTGLNKKSDNFWHSVYVISDLFADQDKDIENEESSQQQLDFGEKEKRRTKRKLINEVKAKLIQVRRPYLIEQSDRVIKDLKESDAIPDLPVFGIYDEESYNDLLKTVYVISPSLFVGRSDSERKFICATFAGLLSTQDNLLIQVILEQLQELTEEEKDDLLDILQRTSLSNVVKTIKEIDHRLDVLEKLKILLFTYTKETLEVKHLQKVLDENFWIFGEQFRLFSSTEGALKKVLARYAKDILGIEDADLDSQPSGEVDLFLTRTDATSATMQKNIIIELKRPSNKLGKDEFDQIEKYMREIKKQGICNGVNQYWEFYLIGNEYDDYIEDKIKQAKAFGESERGLVIVMNDFQFKVYVRKWSDILEVEWGSKMIYLKEKLEIQPKKDDFENPADLTKELTK